MCDHMPSVSYNTRVDKLGQTDGLFILEILHPMDHPANDPSSAISYP